MEKRKKDLMYQAPDKSNWKGRTDSLHDTKSFRWHQVMQMLDLSQPLEIEGAAKNVAIIGFCSDEGVRRNQGRPGAVEGPDAIRKALASMPVHFSGIQLFDAGNIICADQKLEAAQNLLGKKLQLLFDHNILPIVLGGGHEVSFGHYLGYQNAGLTDKLGIINIDAHFDLRSYENGAHSGSPFLQIADESEKNGHAFSYRVLGIQKFANSKQLFEKAEQLQVIYLSEQECTPGNMAYILTFLDWSIRDKEHIYLTICLDAIAAAHAPGVSAPNAFGLQPEVVRQIIKYIVNSGKLTSLDIAELNPKYDIDNRTAKLAAILVFESLDAFFRN